MKISEYELLSIALSFLSVCLVAISAINKYSDQKKEFLEVRKEIKYYKQNFGSVNEDIVKVSQYNCVDIDKFEIR